MGILVALLLAGSPIEVEPGSACVTVDSLRQRLARLGPGFSLTIRRANQAVVVDAVLADGRAMRREVPAPAAECEAVEQMIFLLLASWTKDSGVPLVRAPPVVERKPRSAPVVVVAEPVVAPKPAGPKPVPVVVVAPPPVVTQAPSAVAGLPPAPAPTPVVIQLMARGGVTARTPPAPLPAAELALTVTYGGWGVALSGGLSDATERALGPSKVSLSAGWASLGVAAVKRLGSRLAVEGAIGGRLLALAAAATQRATLVSGGAYAEAGLTCRIAGPLHLGVWGSTSVRTNEERLSIGGIDAYVTVPRWQFTALAGAGLQWP